MKFDGCVRCGRLRGYSNGADLGAVRRNQLLPHLVDGGFTLRKDLVCLLEVKLVIVN